jgi:hypothetical protein
LIAPEPQLTLNGTTLDYVGFQTSISDFRCAFATILVEALTRPAIAIDE